MNPQRPTTLPLLAEAILAALSDEPLAGEIVLGGGVALKHYDDFRPTQDIDAWWCETRDAEAMARTVPTQRDRSRPTSPAWNFADHS